MSITGYGAPARPNTTHRRGRIYAAEWPRKGTGEQRLADRARIVLLSHEGVTVEMIAEHLHTRPARVSKWRQRFVEGQLSALSDAPRPGKPHTYTEETEPRVLRLLDQAPPDGYAQWNGPLLAEALGDVSTDHWFQAPDDSLILASSADFWPGHFR